MGLLTSDMKRVVEEQRLGFVATVCPNGTPNLSPKGTTAVWDDEQLVFANIRSPNTIANLRRGVVSTIREVVMVRVQSAQPLISPAYDLGLTEDEVRARWEGHWQSVRAGKSSSPTGE